MQCTNSFSHHGVAQNKRNAEIANMHSPGTHKHTKVSFVYFISVPDALFNAIQIPTQTFIRPKTRA